MFAWDQYLSGKKKKMTQVHVQNERDLRHSKDTADSIGNYGTRIFLPVF